MSYVSNLRAPRFLALCALLSAGLSAGGSAHAATPASAPVAATAGRATPIPAGDEVITGVGDAEGYHLYAASAGDGFTWRALATIQPAGYGDEKWIGRQCLTGDGRTVVAVVAPWGASNTEQGMDRGGIAYAIDAHTGAARPLAGGLSLAYFNPGCGADGQVALTGYLGAQQAPTRITVIDTAHGDDVTHSVTVAGELTSAAAVADRVLAARGGTLVDVGTGTAKPVASFPGQVEDIRPATDGGVDLVAQGSAASGVWHVTAAGAKRLVGDGPRATTDVFGGHAGRNTAVYSRPSGGDLESLSLDGGHAVVIPQSASLNVSTAEVTTFASGHAGTALSPATLPAPTVRSEHRLPAGLAAAMMPSGATTPRSMAAGTANTTIPQCAVPRNDLFKQVWQPTSDQVRWAVYQAIQGYLTSARPTNPANYATVDSPFTQIGTAAPNSDFPVLSGAPAVPPQVMFGILAQESNFLQASWHAAPGRSGNPLIADYYGITSPNNPSPGQLDYNYADCGYGIAQITTGMTLTGGASTPSDEQLRIAVDYAENIAAAAQILQQKWQQLAGLGIISGSADGTKLENWYEAIWGYNTGVYTDPASSRGLGWLNNPANPIYKANRHPFLYYIDTSGTSPVPIQEYNDAKTPANWPYQERVFGWMQVPQVDSNGNLEYRGTYNWSTNAGHFLQQPAANAFCNAGNSCTPSYVGSGTDPCPSEDSSCWWDQPVPPCSGSCVTDTPSNPANGRPYYPAKTAEPSATPSSATCTLGANTPVTDSTGKLLAGTVLVDDEALPDQNPGVAREPNLMGCAANTALVAPSSANASFALLAPDGKTIDAASSPAESAAFDLHQLGAGVGGHLFFTHTRPTSDSANEVTGRWQATLPTNTVYQIEVFVPDIAAASTHATYEIDTGGSVGSATTYGSPGSRHFALRRTINQATYTNKWVSLGYYLPQGSGTMKVTLRTVTPSDDSTQGADIAFNALAFVPVPAGSYVALGDSYSAGEGVGSGFDDGTDVTDDEQGDNGDLCHRSSLSYPRLYAAAKNLPIVHLACSGSNSNDVAGINFWYQNSVHSAGVLGSYGLPSNDGSVCYEAYPDPTNCPGTWYSAGHTDQLSGDTWNYDNAGSDYYREPSYQTDLLAALKPRLVTVTVGGNDTGFADIVGWCVSQGLAYGSPQSQPCQTTFSNGSGPDKIDKRISSLQSPMTDALTAVAKAAGGPGKVVLLTYPNIFQGTANGMGPYGTDCTAILGTDQDYLKTKVPELDNMLIAAAAAASKNADPTGKTKIRVVDERNAFAGHEACTASPDATPPTIPPSSTSQEDNFFHPNAAGYAKLAADLEAAVPSP